MTVALVFWRRQRGLTEEDLERSDVGRVSTGLLGSLSLLFIPAGVGVVQYLGLLGEHGIGLALALVGSTVATMLATVGVFLGVKRLLGAGAEPAA